MPSGASFLSGLTVERESLEALVLMSPSRILGLALSSSDFLIGLTVSSDSSDLLSSSSIAFCKAAVNDWTQAFVSPAPCLEGPAVAKSLMKIAASCFESFRSAGGEADARLLDGPSICIISCLSSYSPRRRFFWFAVALDAMAGQSESYIRGSNDSSIAMGGSDGV